MLGVGFILKLIVVILVVGVILPQASIFWIERSRVKNDPHRVKLHTREKDK